MHKERSGTIWLEKREDAYDRENGESKLRQKLPTPASRGNGIKMDVVVVVSHKYFTRTLPKF